MECASRYCNHVGCAGRHVGLAVTIAAPGNHASVFEQREHVPAAGADSLHAGKTGGNIGLSTAVQSPHGNAESLAHGQRGGNGIEWWIAREARTSRTNLAHGTSDGSGAISTGLDAMKFVNSPLGRQLQLRGINARVVQPGRIRAGERVARVGHADARAFEKDLSDSLGLKVEIKPGSGESGTLSIKYGNFDQLDYIRARLIGPPER